MERRDPLGKSSPFRDAPCRGAGPCAVALTAEGMRAPPFDNFTSPRRDVMKKVSVVKVQKLKTTAVALYPIWECWPWF